MKYKMTRGIILFLFIATVPISVLAQRCDSIAAASIGDWRPVSSAPRDGTVVEMLETYGIAPWYGIFKWTRDATARDQNGKLIHFKTKPYWRQVDDPSKSVIEDACLFWRPYKKTGKYIDPTGGAQQSVAYWCGYMHMRYNKKKDVCE